MTASTFPIYYVNAFTDQLFKGNPAAIILLDEWLDDTLLISLAAEINLSETAFIVDRHIRWFTPKIEVDLCGHATLAAAFIIDKLSSTSQQPIIFQSKSGELIVTRTTDGFTLDFPQMACSIAPSELKDHLSKIIHTQIDELYLANDRYICFLSHEQDVASCSPDFDAIAQLPLPGLCITALSQNNTCDFVSRYFAPAKGVNEDPVTGTTHCAIAPLWAKRLNKNQLTGHQISVRGGFVDCKIINSRVHLSGRATLFLTGTIQLENYLDKK